MSFAFEPEILQDFLTESGELLERLESDLVSLEKSPGDPEMINQVFRALHTIKGSASFLALNNLVRIAHAAEGALNAARNSIVKIDRGAMDLLLGAVDIIKTQLGQVEAGQELSTPPQHLVDGLTRLSEGKQSTAASSSAPTKTASQNPTQAPIQTPPASATVRPITTGPNQSPTQSAAPAAAGPDATEPQPEPGAMHVTPISFPEGKAELVEFLVADVTDSLSKAGPLLAALRAGDRHAAEALTELSEALVRGVVFFEVEPLTKLANAFGAAAAKFESIAPERHAQMLPRMDALIVLLSEVANGLRAGELRVRPSTQLIDRLNRAMSDDGLPPGDCIAPGADAQTVMVFDGVVPPAAPAATDSRNANATGENTGPARSESEAPAPEQDGDAAGSAKAKVSTQIESTIRVEVGRLESLMNLVGELVLQKNRISAIARKLAAAGGRPEHSTEFNEAMTLAAGALDRVTGDIQTAVMKTRMQPLDKLFGKYPRLIRDLASKTGKKIQLVIEGGDTEVDKSVIEELGDPLVHLLRNAADHGLEPPADRLAKGKSETGTITLRASHEGSHVRLLVIDDGRGLMRERIAAKAVERGLATTEQVQSLSDRDVFRFIFEAGFSTAENVSDLSGRGVGMDVVRTNIEKVKGTIDLESGSGKGTTVIITIPLTVAILPAMMVAVGEEVYAIPLGNILEIVKLDQNFVSTIGEHPVIRLRNSVLPLISAADAFNQPPGADGKAPVTPFAVVLSQNERRIGLTVSRLIGQQEIVVKPLDGVVEHRGGAISGATVRDDGGVSLIADINRLMRLAETMKVSAA